MSDLAAFVLEGVAYVVGGYDQDYSAQATLFKFNPQTNTFEDSNLPMTFARGDISAVTYNGAAYILGGWSDINGFAQPFNDVHRFDGKAWEAFTPLLTARGDKVAMVLNDRLHVVGGELVGGTANVGMEVWRWRHVASLLDGNFALSLLLGI
eukprot:m.56344 g.56344  ORF g.56344 m.56344 type:complete len:152 (-) comp13683_c0_seq51:496-951(-)